jgi:predicted transcriptional regulator
VANTTRGVRVSDELWDAAKSITAEQGEHVTDVIVRALEQYVRSHGWEVDPVTALERLARLHAAGLIPDDEWGVVRRTLLSRI